MFHICKRGVLLLLSTIDGGHLSWVWQPGILCVKGGISAIDVELLISSMGYVEQGLMNEV